LQPGRQGGPKMNHVDEIYVDIGAKTAEEVREAGVDVLDAVSLDYTDYALGDEAYAGPGIGDHFGVVALVELLQHLKGAKARVRGTLTVAFVGQSWIGGRGLERVLNEIHPDEMIYVGRFFAAKSQSNSNAP